MTPTNTVPDDGQQTGDLVDGDDRSSAPPFTPAFAPMASADPAYAAVMEGEPAASIWSRPRDGDPNETGLTTAAGPSAAELPLGGGERPGAQPLDGVIQPAGVIMIAPDDDDDESWEDDDVLPPPRGKLLTPITWVLILLLFGGAGFALGVKMEKSHATSVAQAAVASQLNQLRTRAGGTATGGFAGFGGAGGTGTGAGAGTGTGTGSGTGTGRTGGGTGAAATPAAEGVVKLVDGDKVYVQAANGDVIIVSAGTGVAVTQSSSGSVADLKPGQNVVVQGTTNDDGTVTASAIAAVPAGSAATGTSTPAGAGQTGSTPAGGAARTRSSTPRLGAAGSTATTTGG